MTIRITSRGFPTVSPSGGGGGGVSGIDGSIQFATAGDHDSDAANFFWDKTLAALGLGTNTIDANVLLKMVSTTKGFLKPSLTFTQMLAIVSPINGLKVFCNDTTVSTDFTYNSTFGRWTAPEYIILTNEDTITSIAGDIMTVSTTTDFNVLLATVANDIDIAGVCVIGGIQNATILVKYNGEVLVNVLNAAVRGNKIAVGGITAGKGVGTPGALPGVFGIAIANKVGSQIRTLIGTPERF